MKRSNAQLLRQLIPRIGLPLLMILFVEHGLEQYLTQLIQSELMSSEGATNWVWIFGALNVGLSILVPLLETYLIFLALSSLLELPRREHLYRDLVREELRAFGHVFWGFLLFIIPGVVVFLRLLLVPFVVAFDPSYARGHRDALAESGRLWRKSRRQILVYSALFVVLIPLLFSLADDWNRPFQNPIVSLPFQIVEGVILIYSHLVLFKLWRKSNESLLPVE